MNNLTKVNLNVNDRLKRACVRGFSSLTICFAIFPQMKENAKVMDVCKTVEIILSSTLKAKVVHVKMTMPKNSAVIAFPKAMKMPCFQWPRFFGS